jgi:hypothetical protein
MNETFACGAMTFIRLALQDHRKQFQGKIARRVVLHPETFKDFMVDPYARHCEACNWGNRAVFFEGTEIVESLETGTPKLINCKNEEVYL